MTPTTAQPVSEGTDGLQIESGRDGATRPILPPGARAVKTADLTLLEALGYGQPRFWLEIRMISGAGEVKRSWYRKLDALLKAWPALESANRAGYNVYFGICPRGKQSGKREAVSFTPALWADLDGKDFAGDWRAGKALAFDVIAELPQHLQPSALVDSGHGLQAYWILREPLPATPDNVRAVEATNAALAEYLGGDDVGNVDRIFRLPGLLNVKAEYAEPAPCDLAGAVLDQRYSLADFAWLLTPSQRVDGKQATNGAGLRPGDDFNAHGDWSELLTKHGWAEVGKKKAGGASLWRRPGKDSGISARLNRGGDGLLWVYSSNAGALQSGTPYTLFGAYAALEHAGNCRAAAEALAAQGYGEQNGTDPKSATVVSNGTAPKPATPTRWSTMADLDGVLDDITWDWPGWIAPGFAHLIVAEPGLGKSMLVLGTSGSYLLGRPWPDGTPFRGETGLVLWCETEAGHAPNRERAKAWGLPTERILYPVENPLDSISLQNLEHMATVRYLAQRDDVKLIVVDSFSGGNARDENDAESGQVVKMLAELARDTNKPLLITHHLNKAWRSNRITLTNIRGSTAIAQYVRLIWALDKPDPEQAALRLYAIKSNLAKLPGEIGLAIGANGLTTLPTAPQVPRGDTVLDKAIDFLLDALEREPLPKREIEELAEGLSISGASLRRAADKLAIVKLKNRDGPWMWSLPTKRGEDRLQ